MRKAIYTVLVGKYDELKQPLVVDSDFDYICFSNDIATSKVGVWNIRPISFQDSNRTRVSRYPKLLPHKTLPEYDYSLYLDANIQIVDKNLYQYVNQGIEKDCLIAQVPNIFRDCIYKDMEIAYRKGKVGLCDTRRQYNHLKQEGFPEHFGLYENNVILRKHNSKNIIAISEDWWHEYSTYTHRDQFCLMYVYWKHGFMPDLLLGEGHNARNSVCLKLIPHHNGGSFTQNIKWISTICDKGQSFKRKLIWHLMIG